VLCVMCDALCRMSDVYVFMSHVRRLSQVCLPIHIHSSFPCVLVIMVCVGGACGTSTWSAHSLVEHVHRVVVVRAMWCMALCLVCAWHGRQVACEELHAIHKHTHTHTCTHTYAHTQTYNHTHSNMQTHTCTRTLIYTDTHKHTYACTHARTRARTQAHTHARTYARTHTPTHKHTHPPTNPPIHTHTQTHTRTNKHTHTHTHKHTHTHLSSAA